MSGPDGQASHPGTQVPSIVLLRLPTKCPHVRAQGWSPATSVFTSLQVWGKQGNKEKQLPFQQMM